MAETVDDMKLALQMSMPDLKHVENWQLGYVLDCSKKYTIETNVELQDAFEHVKRGYQMWLDHPQPMQIQETSWQEKRSRHV